MSFKFICLIGSTTIAVSLQSISSCLFSEEQPSLTLPGVVETHEIRLGSRVGGRVSQVSAREGTIVETGTPLVVLEVPELQARRAQLTAQRDAATSKLQLLRNTPHPDELRLARAALEIAEADLKLLVAGNRAEEIEIARLAVETSESEEKHLHANYDRIQQLNRKNAASTNDCEQAETDLYAAARRVASNREHWKMLTSGPRPEEISVAQAKVSRLTAELKIVERGPRAEEVAQAESQLAEWNARIDEIDAQLRESVIASPSRCRVEVVSARRGDLAAPNQPIVRVLCLEDVWVKSYVAEPDLANLRINQAVNVTHNASDRVFSGTITHIAGVSEFTPRNVQSPDERQNQVFAFKVKIDNAAGVFKPGMAATVHVPLEH